ncbi:uncharacterized protein LOC103314843 [Tribolium castaneum]|uniref:CHK kinase-like domain-containing protein n=1 Tax=Tribolium castaneum TaxID=7070 RepID=D6WTW6_TRICA|nr:PREDICTED: uncharacterized protein LOC103314843 [Tribolium castaneum]XP_015836807.1 PREDICTED: uncharacterized protein LOC103314843 [Tribolium castaneum]EFA07343.1 hypothetical protein TcasGA2_TC015939 [Tribolium castaneum]|eukprot:XP_008200144.1 PREDICTED: uncharacterized protein LOC103314843 [Tribolium castaneum]
MTTPEWISNNLFQKALNNYFNEDLQLVTFTSTNAVPEGDNYTSDLFRSTLIYINPKKKTKHSLSVIVKCGNDDGGVKTDLAKKLHLFDKEIEMFTRTFPAIYEILGEHYTLSSKCLYACNDPHSVIVLEDLTTLNFEMLPRHIGFDLEHCCKVVEKMAQMHAASVIMYENDPSLVKCYAEGLYADNEMIREWVSAGYGALSDACSRWPGFEKYGYKLSALGDEALERGFKATKRRLGGFNVLNHGDLWVNNMMFSYHQDGKLKDMRFVDFQMNIFTSPAIDLHYFIATSTKVEVKLECIEIILDHYYAQLLANLARLQYSLERVPTREQFKKDYNARAFYGLMGAATVLAFVKASSRKDASFESVMRDGSVDGFRYHAYNNERYRKHMEHLLPYYDSFGILD